MHMRKYLPCFFSNSGGLWAGWSTTVGRCRVWAAAEGGNLRVRVWVCGLGFGVWGLATGPRGIFGGGCRTDGGGGVWAERLAVAAPPGEVVEEDGWARFVVGASW
jgi:hypothetical protein